LVSEARPDISIMIAEKYDWRKECSMFAAGMI